MIDSLPRGRPLAPRGHTDHTAHVGRASIEGCQRTGKRGGAELPSVRSSGGCASARIRQRARPTWAARGFDGRGRASDRGGEELPSIRKLQRAPRDGPGISQRAGPRGRWRCDGGPWASDCGGESFRRHESSRACASASTIRSGSAYGPHGSAGASKQDGWRVAVAARGCLRAQTLARASASRIARRCRQLQMTAERGRD
jgi:hypothetical protein